MFASTFLALIAWNLALTAQLGNQQAALDSLRFHVARHTEALLMATSSEVVIRPLQPTALAPSAQVRLLLDRSDDHALLIASNLPPLRPGQRYQVWFGQGGLRREAGQLDIDRRGNGDAQLILPPDGLAAYDAAWITLEPSQGTPTPNGAGVARGAL
jgi:hypothetical protein